MKVGVGDIADTIVPSGAQGSSAITRADKTLRKMFWRMKIPPCENHSGCRTRKRQTGRLPVKGRSVKTSKHHIE